MRAIILGLGVMLGVSLLLLFGWYQIDGQPSADVEGYLQSSTFHYQPLPEGGYRLTPVQANGKAVLIMHGALVKPLAYAETAAFFAEKGYTVVVPDGGWTRLSINAAQQTKDSVRTEAALEWYFIGHSMGGFASLEAIRSGHLAVRGVALWAAAMPNDYSDLDIPVLLLLADRDGLLHGDRLEGFLPNYPSNRQQATITGGNHRNFARYTHQFFDREATIPVAQQIAWANQKTLAFFQSMQ